MIGAIVTTAAFALLCSILATVGNLAIARDFPDFKHETDADAFADPLCDPVLAVRHAQYRVMTNLFYHQSRVLWALLVLLVGYKFLFGGH